MLEAFVYFLGMTVGLMYGYLFWAPAGPAKQAILDGMMFKFLRKKK